MTKKLLMLKIAGGTVFSLIGLYMVISNFIPINKSEYLLPEKDLTTLTGYLINDPFYHKSTGAKGSSTYFTIELNTYPGLEFRNETAFLKATDWESINREVKYHDTVSLKVLKSAFEKYYLNKESMTIFQKFANYPYDRFKFYSFKCRNKEYVSDLYEAAKQDRSDKLAGKFIFGLIFMAMGIYCFFAKE